MRDAYYDGAPGILVSGLVWATAALMCYVLGVERGYPAREFATGNVEGFRHCLDGLIVSGVELPQLSVCMEDGVISFDYRAGTDWNEQTVLAQFEFQLQLKLLCPNARIFQADPGGYSTPNAESSEALLNFEPPPTNKSLQA